MLTMVMEKPMQLTMVNDVPLDCSGAFLAIKVENKGESATTVIPQKIKNEIRTKPEAAINIRGERIQQRQDKNKEIVAILFTPNF